MQGQDSNNFNLEQYNFFLGKIQRVFPKCFGECVFDFTSTKIQKNELKCTQNCLVRNIAAITQKYDLLEPKIIAPPGS